MPTKRELESEHDLRVGWLMAICISSLVWTAVIGLLAN